MEYWEEEKRTHQESQIAEGVEPTWTEDDQREALAELEWERQEQQEVRRQEWNRLIAEWEQRQAVDLMAQVTGGIEYTTSTEPAPLPSIKVKEQTIGYWLVQVEQDEKHQTETPVERRARESRQEIKDHRRLLKHDVCFRKIVQTLRRLQDGPERREEIRSFWNETYEEVYSDPLVQGVRGDPLRMRAAALQVCTELEDEGRRETGRESQVIRPHAPFRGSKVTQFPLRGPRSAGTALLQE
jgi:hypothetical protein